jgi:Heterokaryon incompatibility protein (HET)
MQPTGQLCQRCAAVDFSLMERGDPRNNIYEKRFEIFWHTLFPEHCDFCQLVNHCINHDQRTPSQLLSNIRGVYYGNELQIYIEEGDALKSLDYAIRWCEGDTAIGFSQMPQEPSRFNPTELKAWLKECDRHQCLPDDHHEHPMPEGFRLIDVDDKCIVQAKEFVEYCALSYVWGPIKQSILTSHNVLESPGALDALKLPKTISDAMALCRDINCRYLWVDSLCIMQDSDEIKHKQIGAMADVYSRSFLAIVAAAGDNANAGLPPYGNIGRRFPISYLVRQLSAGRFVASFSPQIAAQEIVTSKWASRGWTLQEYALSRRVLFFTGSYTFLRCEESLLCEDFGVGFSDYSKERQIWDLPVAPFYRKTSDPSRFYPRSYSDLLCQYLRRSLTYENDILDAFAGLLAYLEPQIGKHIFGLPSKEFGAALQWQTDQPFPCTQRSGFPSWSWAGWIHSEPPSPHFLRLHDLYESRDEKLTNITAITCYQVGDDRALKCFQKYNIEDVCSLFMDEMKRYEGLTRACETANELRRLFVSPNPLPYIYPNWQSPSNSPLSHHVFIWANCASLYVDPILFPYPKAWCCAIRIRKDTAPIGFIHLRLDWREAQAKPWMEFMVSTVGVHSPHPDNGLRSTKVKVTIILIKPLYDSQPPVYRRIQVAEPSIHFKDWRSADPKSRLIILV